MAFIENLERDNWKEFFSEMFQFTLWTLRHNRFGHVGSSASDLRSWLALGGIPRLRHHIDHGMEMRRIPDDRAAEVREHITKLAHDNRSELVALAQDGIIAASRAPELEGLTVSDVEDALRRIARGERPFEDWMYSHGHTYEEVIEVYKAIDEWLVDNGIISKPGPLPTRQ